MVAKQCGVSLPAIPGIDTVSIGHHGVHGTISERGEFGSGHALPGVAEAKRDERVRVLLAGDHRVVREGPNGLIHGPGIEVVGKAAHGQAAVEQAWLLRI